MQRVVVIGTTGSGKTYFSKQLAEILSCPFYELDSIYWKENWQACDLEEMRETVTGFSADPAWVCDGNYGRVRDILWDRADTVIWLNYSALLTFTRLVRRTVKRVFTREKLFNGCTESFKDQFLSTDSLFIWFFRSYWKNKRNFSRALQDPRNIHLNQIVLKTPRQTDRFLQNLHHSE